MVVVAWLLWCGCSGCCDCFGGVGFFSGCVV